MSQEAQSSQTRFKSVEKKSAARLLAIQALYSQDVLNTSKKPEALALEFLAIAEDFKQEGLLDASPNQSLVANILLGVSNHQDSIDKLISDHLNEQWNLQSIGALSRAILRAGVYELLENTDTSQKVIINEYVDIAHGYFNEQEIGFFNALLDNVGKYVRS